MKARIGRFFTSSGSPQKPVYQTTLERSGIISVKVIGYDDIQEQINSHAESCSIELIVQRCSRGDFSGLSVHQGVYADVTNMPTTYAEILQSVIDGRKLYDGLSDSVKKEFKDFEDWFSQTGSDDWFKKMGVFAEPDLTPAPVDKEVISDES